MPGSAILGTNLVDSLVTGVIDGIREALHPQLGVRQFRVFAVTRRFSGAGFVDEELELRPQPLVDGYSFIQNRSVRYVQKDCGIDEEGVVNLSEISFTYTEAELTGLGLPNGTDFYIKITDALGQGIPDRYFQPAGPPYPDRIEGMGWQLRLVRLSDAS